MKVLSLMNVSLYPVDSSSARYEMMNLRTGYWVIDGTVSVWQYWLVCGGIGSVFGGTSSFLMVMGRYRDFGP